MFDSSKAAACRPDRRVRLGVLFALLALAAPAAHAQWVEFVDETSTRMVSDASLGVSDTEEKDYAWGDLDKDGDIDLVVVRKQPFTSPGKRRNVLFMNENGVFVDRTVDYASASDVPGDEGFLTPTNDRDVVLVDVDGDTWLDMVTAVTISDGDPKHIGHPRVYRNLGLDAGTQEWRGFRFENLRVPTMLSYSGQSGFNPRFCSVAAGDVTGDGDPDLWFGDYDSSGAGGFGQPSGADYNDRLLVNNGSGFFADLTTESFVGNIDVPGTGPRRFEVSAFGAAAVIADMNLDGRKDIVKQTSLNSPLYVGVAYNTPGDEGSFETYDALYTLSPYFVSVDDLNNDSLPDIVITDDGADRYLLNQGDGGGGVMDFLPLGFSYDAASDDGFGSNSLIVDLNNDGWKDVLIADVDVDIGGCSRRMHVYRNLGGLPGSNVVLQEQTTGTGCATSQGNPASCVIAGIPSNKLEGVHDVAVFDINGDGWKDMILGRCSGTQVYISQPPTGLAFAYPQGLPSLLEPDVGHSFQVQISGIGPATVIPGTAKVMAAIGNGPFVQLDITDLGNELYQVTLPAAACTQSIRYFFVAKANGGISVSDPPGAPTEHYTAVAAIGSVTQLDEGFENAVSGWTVVDDPSLTGGSWVAAEPHGTVTGGGAQAAPDEDGEASNDFVKAFVTGNGTPGGAAGAADVDGGPTDLISPPINLAGTDATITYSRWFFTDGDDALTVAVSVDGNTWQTVETVTGQANSWQVSSFRVGQYVTPGPQVRVRFRTADSPNNSITEAAIDAFRVDAYVCAGCGSPAECDDGNFCNGAEQCLGGLCQPGDYACPGEECDETTDECVECLDDGDCDDGNFCNGAETCAGDVCVPGSEACPGQQCDEGSDVCVDCLVDAECSDGLFCNGEEQCVGGSCTAPAEACPGQLCDEDDDVCIGTVELQPRMGMPLLRLTGGELDRFEAGKVAFDTVLTAPEGLGPIFNQNSCGACHNTPLGGSGSIMVTRFGFSDDKGAGFDPLESLGGSLLQSQALAPECEESVPAQANVTGNRVTPSTLGFGLVEAIPDAAIEANALTPPAGVSGEVHLVTPLETPGGPARVGRFGWKSQVATVLTFSADASLNEMGLTNRLLTQENAPNGNSSQLALCDSIPDPEDGPDGEGLHFIDRVTDFQRFLAPPPQTPRSGMAGETIFNNIGCDSCHTASFTTADDPSLEDAIRDLTLHPYSDFLLHDMGLSGDFIEQGGAAVREVRTTPLWGLRVRDPLWHDGRISGGTFASRILEAVIEHDALDSEARPAAQAFLGLSSTDRAAVVAFLASLGRAEFDSDGDNDVDPIDFQAFGACFTGPGSFYVPDDACSIHDVDQDGDVDADDRDLFLAAFPGQPAGTVPDGAGLPGTQLTVEPAGGGNLELSWDASCVGADTDYAIYEGTVGDFASHAAIACSTGGDTTRTITPGGGDRYYLVVPTNGTREGSYGFDSAGAPRPAAAIACLPQAVETCD